MRILLDGKDHTAGHIEDEVREQLELDPEFDISRLTYHSDDLKAQADQRAVAFAASARDAIVQEPDALRRDGWTMKGVMAVAVLLRTSPEVFDAMIIPAVIQSFGAEAERRGIDETPQELLQASAGKMLEMLFATSLVEGNLRGLQKAMDAAEPEQLDAILAGAKEAADGDMAMLQAST